MNKHAFALQLGARIRERRKLLKMTQAELAGTDFTKSFISQIEKGQASPAIWSLVLIARRLDCTIGHLIGETDSAPGPRLGQLALKVGIEPDRAVRYLEAVLAQAKEDFPQQVPAPEPTADIPNDPRPS